MRPWVGPIILVAVGACSTTPFDYPIRVSDEAGVPVAGVAVEGSFVYYYCSKAVWEGCEHSDAICEDFSGKTSRAGRYRAHGELPDDCDDLHWMDIALRKKGFQELVTGFSPRGNGEADIPLDELRGKDLVIHRKEACSTLAAARCIDARHMQVCEEDGWTDFTDCETLFCVESGGGAATCNTNEPCSEVGATSCDRGRPWGEEIWQCTADGWQPEHDCLPTVEQCTATSPASAHCAPAECVYVYDTICVDSPSVEIVASCGTDGFWAVQDCAPGTCEWAGEDAQCQ